MKYVFILIVVLFFSHTLYSQDTTHIFYNNEWKETKRKSKIEFHRKLYKSNELWVAEDYYLNGNLQMIGSFEDKECDQRHGEFKYYYKNGLLDHKGEYKNNKKEGEWNWLFENGKIAAYERYSNNEKIEMQYWDENGIEVSDTEAEHIARFMGDTTDRTFYVYIASNIIYPIKLSLDGIEGKVMVSIVIEKDGTVTNAKIIEPSHPLFNAEALRVFRNSPKWDPAKQHNRCIRSIYNFPLIFKLSN